MDRVNLPQQTPEVPDGLFFPMNDLYIWGRNLDSAIFKVNGKQLFVDSSKASDIVLAGENALQFTMVPGRVHVFHAILFVSANVKLRHVGPGGCTVRIVREVIPSGGAFSKVYDAAFSAADIVPGALAFVELEGSVFMPVGTSGKFEIHWAQNASNATPSVIYAGSRLQYSLVAE